MDHSKVAVRYAKAFFDLGREKGKLELLKTDIDLVEKLSRENPDFLLLLESPVIKTSQKLKLVNEVFMGQLNELSLRFLRLVVTNKREAHLPGICRNFNELYRKVKGIRLATLTSAIPLVAGVLDQVKQKLETELKAEIELTGRVNKDLIGGFILRFDDQQVDASVAAQLQKVSRKLLQTEIIK